MMKYKTSSAPCPPGHARAEEPVREVTGATSAAGFLRGLSGGLLASGGLLFVCLIALLDYKTGPYLSFGIFYLIPVMVCAWWGGFSVGILLALAASVVWSLVDALENPSIPDLIIIWNGLTRFATLALASRLVSRLHSSILQERRLARTDALTGAANARTFYQTAAQEAVRSFRAGRPLTLAYFDLDDFKRLNDRLGHAAGDAALVYVVRIARVNLRATDLLARLGGDEFALLLPEMAAEAAVAVLARVQQALAEEMARLGLPITLSVGAITFLRPDWDVDQMIQRVDALMYEAKQRGKARFVHAVEPGLRQAVATDAPVERRASNRVPCNRRVSARLVDGSLEVFMTLRDLSTDGVGFVHEQPLAVGTLLVIEPLTDGPRALLAKVVRTHPGAAGWVHGCKLSTHLSDEELCSWVDRREAASLA